MKNNQVTNSIEFKALLFTTCIFLTGFRNTNNTQEIISTKKQLNSITKFYDNRKLINQNSQINKYILNRNKIALEILKKEKNIENLSQDFSELRQYVKTINKYIISGSCSLEKLNHTTKEIANRTRPAIEQGIKYSLNELIKKMPNDWKSSSKKFIKSSKFIADELNIEFVVSHDDSPVSVNPGTGTVYPKIIPLNKIGGINFGVKLPTCQKKSGKN
jgi:hypothetical protein